MQDTIKQPQLKRAKRDITAEQKATSKRLSEQLEEHDQNRVAVQETLRNYCNRMRELIDGLEESINGTLEVSFNKEDDRLQEKLSKLNGMDSTDAENEEAAWDLIDKANAELLVVQSYCLVKQKSEDAKNTEDTDLPDTYKLVVKKRLRGDWASTRRPTDLVVESVAPGEIRLGFTSLSANEEKVIRENGLEGEVTYRALLRKKGGEEEEEEDAAAAAAGREYPLGRGKEGAGAFSFTPDPLEPEAEYEVRVKVACGGRESEWSEAAEFATGGYSECCEWSERPSPKEYVIDKKNPRVVKKSWGANVGRVAVGSAALPDGRTTSWSVRVLSSRSSTGHGIYVGVKSAANDNEMYLFGCYDSVVHRGLPNRHYGRGREYGVRRTRGRYVRTGDSVGVVVDTARGEISFALNGVCLGVAFEGIPPHEPLVPCVLLENGGDSVRFEPWEMREDVAGHLQAPSGIAVSGVTHDSVTLSWCGAGRGAFYQIEVDGSKAWAAARAGTFTKGGLLPETMYRFRVRTVKGRSVSEWSDVVTVTTEAEVEAAPAEEEAATDEEEGAEVAAEGVEEAGAEVGVEEADEVVLTEDSLPEQALCCYNKNQVRAPMPNNINNNFFVPQEINQPFPHPFICPPNPMPNFCGGRGIFGNVGMQGQGCFGGCFYQGHVPYPMVQNINYPCPRHIFV